MKYIFIFSTVIFMAGCATLDSVGKNYEKINYSDGISPNEAKLIGKNQLISSADKNDYDALGPNFLTHIDKKEKKYSEYYFVIFYPKNTPAFFSSSRYLVVINKKAGDVLFSGSWDFKYSKIEWLFDGTTPRFRYFSDVRSRIRYYAYKNYERLDEGSVFIKLTLLKDGTVKNVEIDKKKTKASDYLINLAIQAVKDSSPFPPFPVQLQEFSEKDFRFVIDFVFD